MFVLSFQLYLLREIVHGQKAKKDLPLLPANLSATVLANFFLLQKTSVFNTMTYSLGCLLIVSACIYYFWELFQSRSSVNLVRQPSFLDLLRSFILLCL